MSICQFTRSPAVCEPHPGGKLMMFDGMIQGEFVSLEANKAIEMKWKFKEWPSFAELLIRFDALGTDACEITLDYKNIPDTDSFGGYVNLEKLQDGWNQNIFKNIRMVFGYPLRSE